MIRFGSDILTFNVVNYFARSADNLLIGWRWGPGPLGLYDKAYSMLLLPIDQISHPFRSIAVPTLSRMVAEPKRLARTYCSMVELIGSLSIPLLVGLAVFADEVVLLWLGANWLEAAELFRLLSLAALVRACRNPGSALLVSLGKTARLKRLGIVTSIATVAAFVIGLPFGAQGVAIAHSASQLVLFVPAWRYNLRDTPVRFGDVLRAYKPALVSSIIAAGAALLCRHAGFLDWNLWTNFALAAVVYAAVYLFLFFGVFRRWPLYRNVLDASGFFRGRFAPNSAPTA